MQLPARAGWIAVAALIALALALPLAGLAAPLLGATSPSAWPIGRYALTTASLGVGVCALSLVFGVVPAWLVSAYRFPGRGAMSIALALPLALPAYLAACTYSGIFDFAGPLQTALRHRFGPGAARWVPHHQVTSVYGLAVVMAAVLYPYVYLIARASFRQQPAALYEAARLLGRSRAFLAIALPLARPAIAGATLLVLIETVGEFGAAHYFGVDTLTTAIVRHWGNDPDPGTAVRIAIALLLVVVALAWGERALRGRRRFAARRGERTLEPVVLGRVASAFALGACAVPVLVGFAIPVGQLVLWAFEARAHTSAGELARLLARTSALAGAAAAVATALALVVAFVARLAPGRTTRAIARVATLGYAVPGAVVALGALLACARADGWISDWRGGPRALVLSGSYLALVWVYAARFCAVSHGAIESGFARLGPHVEEAALNLGARPITTLLRVSAPLVRRSIAAGFVLAFVDAAKELPATLMMRPIGCETLAIRAYQLAGDEQIARAAPYALAIVALGLVPVAIAERLAR